MNHPHDYVFTAAANCDLWRYEVKGFDLDWRALNYSDLGNVYKYPDMYEIREVTPSHPALWMVVGKPYQTFPTLEAASQEARSLAKHFDGDLYILKAERKVRADVVIHETHEVAL